MTDALKYDFTEMTQVVNQLLDHASSIETILLDLDKEAFNLSMAWTGAASDAYQTAQKSWLEDGAELKIVLADIIAMLKSIIEAHTLTDGEVDDLWST